MGVVAWSAPVDLVDLPAALQVVLTRVAVLVLSSAARTWFRAEMFLFV
jgi:hypothetical protein